MLLLGLQPSVLASLCTTHAQFAVSPTLLLAEMIIAERAVA
jgi:hypothetical protein